MKAAEIRAHFLNYFKDQGHTLVESSSLVPQDDPSLLFTNAGMVQFKDFFLGNLTPPYSRAVTSQKCVRAGGKHNDLENVGVTARHHTFFEMLGNFSFGDYFKKEAIHYAWEFVTKVLKLPKEQLYVSIFEKDDEAGEIWHLQEGVPLDRIYRFGEKDNFWSMGETGPCGPCSELFIDRGAQYGCERPTCGMGCDCDRYMEFWNLVFMQFERLPGGQLRPLPKPSVDTGAGLERLASILQKVETNYDTDLFQNIIHKISALVQQPYDRTEKTAISFRVIADHARASVFLVGDGVLPANEGRGYVLRRILRRAIRHGKKLGLSQPFLAETALFVIDEMKEAYPDLIEKKEFIQKVLRSEEEQFLKTLEKGLSLFEDETKKLSLGKTLSGEIAFKLYDTYGFPFDLTQVLCAEKSLFVDEEGFLKAMENQKQESRKHWKGSGALAVESVYHTLMESLRAEKKSIHFVGYDRLEYSSTCLAVLPTENSLELEAIFAETPFYGESGGQMGDRGRVLSEDPAAFFEGEVIDTQKPTSELIVLRIRPIQGQLVEGKVYQQKVDAEYRRKIAANHTATHLLHWALRSVLGKHVKQAGSLVTAELLRFDFTHFQAMSPDELKQVELRVNEQIWKAHSVLKQEMPKEEALSTGAIAFFGEKYSDRVRVVQIGDFSVELCGGTHVADSVEIHLFKIVSESGIASGVRRIVAYTSQRAFEYLSHQEELLKTVRDRLKASSTEEVLGKCDKLLSGEKELKKQLEQLQAKGAQASADEILSHALVLKNFTVITKVCPTHSQGLKYLRELSDLLQQKVPQAVIVLGMPGEKPVLLVAVGPAATSFVHANTLLQQIAHHIEGRGGGKADLAQAGGVRSAGLEAALSEAKTWLMELSGKTTS